jgi:3-deoxy-D-arabino-heptulosonate 7-phosphate (DAHP) synthase
MIVMTPHATPAEIEAVTARLKTTGVHVVVMPGELTTAIGAIGDPEGVAELGLEGMSGVDRVVPISRPYKLASSELYHEHPTVLDIDGRVVGGGETFCLIAGPCTVESREQTLGVARAVKKAGASMLRGGAFKPRTSPFAFKGLGAEGLVILCERGIRTFETATRFTLDLGAVPWLKLHTHLPVIVDPSHAAGDRRLVEPLSRAAAAVGADGIIVEVHEDPEVALCDGPQALEAAHFADYARDVAAHASLLGKRLA